MKYQHLRNWLSNRGGNYADSATRTSYVALEAAALLAEYDVLSTKSEVKVPPDRPDNVLAQPQSKVRLGGGVWVDFSKPQSEVKPDLSAWCTCANEGPTCCQRHPQPQSEYLDLLDERNRLWAENKVLLTKLEARPTVPEDVLVYLRKCANSTDLLRKYDPDIRAQRIQVLETELSALRKEIKE